MSFVLGNNLVFRKLNLYYQDGLVGFITKSTHGYHYNEVQTERSLVSKIMIPLDSGSSSDKIREFMQEHLTYTLERVNRDELFPSWVRSLEDEVYVTKGHFPDTSFLRCEYE